MTRFISHWVGIALLLAVVAVPMVARGTTAQDATPCPPMTEEEAVAWANTYFGAWNSHDPAQVTALYAPDGIHHWGIGADSEGSEELAASLETYFAAFSSLHYTVDRVWLADDTVIIRWIAIGIQEGDLMGVPGSLDTVTFTGIKVLQLNCGLVVETWSEADHFSRLEQMGLIPIGADAEATPTS